MCERVIKACAFGSETIEIGRDGIIVPWVTTQVSANVFALQEHDVGSWMGHQRILYCRRRQGRDYDGDSDQLFSYVGCGERRRVAPEEHTQVPNSDETLSPSGLNPE